MTTPRCVLCGRPEDEATPSFSTYLHGVDSRCPECGKPQGADLVEENAALRRRLAVAHSALRLGMSHLKGHYPVPYKEAEVLATMQAAIDDANKKDKA